ncbi:hypothetical protein D9757_014614 [Collybiopsis confluens]|uniref:Bacteriophage T5 Orf172 DNA-binding domain-containing protein n=1 Tax=Collybiopsis confluens TaxID=2823264 RepID=A0A8H5D9Z9_9AGAR|nr:hypothetical protein D9757_014614 [Collybiopsis confluens]
MALYLEEEDGGWRTVVEVPKTSSSGSDGPENNGSDGTPVASSSDAPPSQSSSDGGSVNDFDTGSDGDLEESFDGPPSPSSESDFAQKGLSTTTLALLDSSFLRNCIVRSLQECRSREERSVVTSAWSLIHYKGRPDGHATPAVATALVLAEDSSKTPQIIISHNQGFNVYNDSYEYDYADKTRYFTPDPVHGSWLLKEAGGSSDRIASMTFNDHVQDGVNIIQFIVQRLQNLDLTSEIRSELLYEFRLFVCRTSYARIGTRMNELGAESKNGTITRSVHEGLNTGKRFKLSLAFETNLTPAKVRELNEYPNLAGGVRLLGGSRYSFCLSNDNVSQWTHFIDSLWSKLQGHLFLPGMSPKSGKYRICPIVPDVASSRRMNACLSLFWAIRPITKAIFTTVFDVSAAHEDIKDAHSTASENTTQADEPVIPETALGADGLRLATFNEGRGEDFEDTLPGEDYTFADDILAANHTGPQIQNTTAQETEANISAINPDDPCVKLKRQEGQDRVSALDTIISSVTATQILMNTAETGFFGKTLGDVFFGRQYPKIPSRFDLKAAAVYVHGLGKGLNDDEVNLIISTALNAKMHAETILMVSFGKPGNTPKYLHDVRVPWSYFPVPTYDDDKRTDNDKQQRQTTNNEQRTTNNERRTTNNKQQTANGEQRAANSKQQTANNKRQTTNGEQQTTNNKQQTISTMTSTSGAHDAKRFPAALENLWDWVVSRKLSGADGPGVVYAYRDHGLWKAGRTRNIQRRMREWARDCPSSDRKWVGWRATPYVNRTEYLLHLALETVCLSRPQFQCNCGKTHLELFELGDDSKAAEDLILEVMEMVVLRLHSDPALETLDQHTRQLGKSLRRFKNNICPAFATKELAKEAGACYRRNMKQQERRGVSNKGKSVPNDTDNEKTFSLTTYKVHAIGTYSHFISMFGTTDSYSTQVGELEHRRIKRFYSHTNKAFRYVRQVTSQERQVRLIQAIRQRLENEKANENSKSDSLQANPRMPFKYKDPLPIADPSTRYQVSKSRSLHLNIMPWLNGLEEDVATKDFLRKLRSHLFCRLTGKHDKILVTQADRGRVFINNNDRIINPRTHSDIMLSSPDDANDDKPYLYARVIGIYHVETSLMKDAKHSAPKRVDFLWVHWYGSLPQRPCWKSRRLPQIGFVDSSDDEAFGFVDPTQVIRAVHLLPNFEVRKYSMMPGPSIARRADEEDMDYLQYYINIFADRDMMTRFCPDLTLATHIVSEVPDKSNSSEIKDEQDSTEEDDEAEKEEEDSKDGEEREKEEENPSEDSSNCNSVESDR